MRWLHRQQQLDSPVSGAQSGSTFAPACSQNGSATTGSFTSPESMCPSALDLAGLISSFHCRIALE